MRRVLVGGASLALAMVGFVACTTTVNNIYVLDDASAPVKAKSDAQGEYLDSSPAIFDEPFDGAADAGRDVWEGCPPLATDPLPTRALSCVPTSSRNAECASLCGATPYFYACGNTASPPRAGDCVRPPGKLGESGVCCAWPCARAMAYDKDCPLGSGVKRVAYACNATADGGLPVSADGKTVVDNCKASYGPDWQGEGSGPVLCCP